MKRERKEGNLMGLWDDCHPEANPFDALFYLRFTDVNAEFASADDGRSEVLVGQIGQVTALALVEGHMAKKLAPL